jgi:hypothetical protein
MTVALALLALLVPASVTLIGYWIKQEAENRHSQEHEEAEKRLALEREESEKRLAQERVQENDRLRLDAAMRAAESVGPSGNAITSAAGLLALARLGFADLAIALLVDLWCPSVQTTQAGVPPQDPIDVSTETAIQVINAALESREPDAQLMAAELLCRHAGKLDISNSLDWPSSVNSAWIPELPVTAKLLIIDAPVFMALASEQTKNALRELAVRLYGVFAGDPEPRVKGCIGTPMSAILPALKDLGYKDFMKGPGHGFVTLKQMEEAALKSSRHPDGYFEAIVEDRSQQLAVWSRKCTRLSLSVGMLAPAACALRDAEDANQLDEAIAGTGANEF